MQTVTLVAALLALQCMSLLVHADDQQSIDVSSLTSVGSVSFKGSTLRVFEIDGAQVAEPRIAFGEICDSLRYNNLYLQYQFTLPISIEVNVLESNPNSSKKIGNFEITELQVKADRALTSEKAKVSVMTKLKKSGGAELIFLCNTFVRCQQLKDDVQSNPDVLQDSVKFIPFGRVGSSSVRFGAIQSASSPRFNCPAGQWTVIQRRVDGNLSFAQNWDAYVNGFGNPESNYWIGLEKLFALTATHEKSWFDEIARCRLRIETESFAGNTYWGEYGSFQVLGSDKNYKLRVAQEVSGSTVLSMAHHSESEFSTYDKDNDKRASGSVSQLFGFGGWWYPDGHFVNLNGAYATVKNIDNHAAYNVLFVESKFLPMKQTLMKIKCG